MKFFFLLNNFDCPELLLCTVSFKVHKIDFKNVHSLFIKNDIYLAYYNFEKYLTNFGLLITLEFTKNLIYLNLTKKL